MRIQLSILSAAVLCLAACGTPGAPRPPSLRLPETVRDLAIARRGSTVTLTWTEPQRTTDGETIRALGPTLVCMGVNDFPMTHCDQMVADLTLKAYAECAPEIGKPARCAVKLDRAVQETNPKGLATYAIEVLNTNGRSAGLSNQVRVPTAPTAEPPRNVRAEVAPDGVTIQGYREELPPIVSNIGFTDHLYRREEGTNVGIDLGTTVSFQSGKNVYPKYVDKTAEWEKTYFYALGTNTTVSLADGSIVDVKGQPSEEVKVFVHDVFPPAAPTGLQAVASGVGQQPFIDLTWAPNTEADLAGYNVYRREEGQQPAKINAELVKTPTFRDAKVQAGKTYLYAVSAVDLQNNESSKSQEASETVH